METAHFETKNLVVLRLHDSRYGRYALLQGGMHSVNAEGTLLILQRLCVIVPFEYLLHISFIIPYSSE